MISLPAPLGVYNSNYLGLPTPLRRVYIINYLGQTQEELSNLTLVSEQVCEDRKRPGIK